MRTPLHLCSRYGHVDAVKELLNSNFDLNASDKVGTFIYNLIESCNTINFISLD